MKTKEGPILMSGAMVRASLREIDPKTQTRRVAKDVKHPDLGNLYAPSVLAREPRHVIDRACPYGQPGDRLWVRETWRMNADGVWTVRDAMSARGMVRHTFSYRADADDKLGWFPSIHMPRWASRLTLEIAAVRVERLQDISEVDCIAEGAVRNDAPGEEWDGSYLTQRYLDGVEGAQNDEPHGSARDWYREIWKKINGPKSWEENPWVWVVEFRRVEGGREA